MDESRKQFESVISGKGWSVQKTDIGDYVHERVQLMWMSWKESRTAIEIELPKIRYGYAGNKEYKPEEVVAAIRAAGIKVKE